MENWKNKYQNRFEYLQKLLYKPAWTITSYVPPHVWLYYLPSDNNTINRTDKINVMAIIQNINPIEIRRALFLSLEIMEPGESSFKPAKAVIQIIQVNDYDETENTSSRIFPEIDSLKFLKRVGDVKLRVSWTDGEYKLNSSREDSYPHYGYYPELVLHVKNIPPTINNTSMVVNPDPASWDDNIQFTAFLNNEYKNISHSVNGGQEMNWITLHIFNNRIETNNITKLFQVGDEIKFSTKDKSIFNEKDSGKNFTYRYSCSDGVIGGENTTWTEMKEGPHIRLNPQIRVKDIFVASEDSNYYWWQKYNFGFKAKSQTPNGETLTVALFTDTPAHPEKYVASQTILVSGDRFTDISFLDIQPFDAADSSQVFRYYFKYSLTDENGNTQSVIKESPAHINTKLVRYPIYSPEMAVNLSLIMVISLLGGVLVERRFYRNRVK